MSKPIEQYAVKTASLKPAGSLSGSYRNVVPICHYERAVARIAELEAQLSSASVQPAGGAVPESWRDVIYNTLRNYRMSTLDDGEGCGYPLIDAMSADGQTVAGGIEECDYLADAIVDSLAAAPHPVSGEQTTDELHRLDKQCRDDVARAMGMSPVGDGYPWSGLLAGIKIMAARPEAQDVAGLVEALEQISKMDERSVLGSIPPIRQTQSIAIRALAANRAQLESSLEESPWIEHGPKKGNPFTHPFSSMVDVRFRNGTEKIGDIACNFMWFWYEHNQRDFDVVAYRAHRAQQGEQPS